MKGYRHLTVGDRNVLARLRAAGASYKHIAQALGCAVSTVSRELARNACAGQGYSAGQAQAAARSRRSAASARPKIAAWVWQTVRWFLYATGAGPKQLAGLLSISHEAIYRWVYARIAAGEVALAQCLRSQRCARLARTVRRALDAARVRPGIGLRDAQAQLRQVPGHWEIDLLGAPSHHAGLIVTLAERATNLTLVRRVRSKHAAAVGAAIARALRPIKAWVSTITTDNGSEFACWRTLQAKLNCAVYASDPGKPAQRAIVEHTNGLIRQYLPKGHDAARLSAAALKRIQFALNHRPRLRLNNRSPIQAFYDATGVALQC
jgi:transposase, IS30 family